jgi:GDPmannose 4,6-dehydratase
MVDATVDGMLGHDLQRALICGVSGQDGAYLAKHLLDLGYEVWGTSRDAEGKSLGNLQRLGVAQRVRLLSMVPEDFRSVFMALNKSKPAEVYYLAGQSSVGLSFELPAETLQSTVMGTLNLLEACRLIERPVRLYHAGSSECFGDTGGTPAHEDTPFSPRSPYAVAKASAFWLVNNYREAYGLFACNGILFNHESPLRPQRFVTQKIVSTACRIAAGSVERLRLGRLDIARDWGWAPEYVRAMHQMLQQPTPRDYIIATGQTSTLQSFVEATFAGLDLDWRAHVDQAPELLRPTDLAVSRADPSRALRELGWQAQHSMADVVGLMVKAQRAQTTQTAQIASRHPSAIDTSLLTPTPAMVEA